MSTYISKKDIDQARSQFWCRDTITREKCIEIEEANSSPYNLRGVALVTVAVNGKKLWSHVAVNLNREPYKIIHRCWSWGTKKRAKEWMQGYVQCGCPSYDSVSEYCDSCGRHKDNWVDVWRNYCDGTRRLTGGSLSLGFEVSCPSCSKENAIKSVIDAMDAWEKRTGRKIEEIFPGKTKTKDAK